MCIRDRMDIDRLQREKQDLARQVQEYDFAPTLVPARYSCCLLYTSDAADERSSVDLGGRRIIKKKKQREEGR